MKLSSLLFALAVALPLLALSPGTGFAEPPLDWDIPDGHFFTQTNARPSGTTTSGYAVTNDMGIPFRDEFQARGGEFVLGFPVTHRFILDGFVTQAFQKSVFQWRPETQQVVFLNTFETLTDQGFDDFLAARQIPRPLPPAPDLATLPFEEVAARHLGLLDQNEAIRAFYFSFPNPIDRFGLPVSLEDFPNVFVIRAQRAAFQFWKIDAPFARAGEVTVVNGGDLAKEAGLWPGFSVVPSRALLEFVPGPLPNRRPDYGMNVFVFGFPDTTQRDLGKVVDANFNWQETLFQWRLIEGAGKGILDFSEADRVVRASNDAGLKIMARVDFAPAWSRADGRTDGPPDNPQDFGDFIFALVDRYKLGSPFGRIHAVELWNEPNLAREWGGQMPNAAQYVELLRAGFEGAKRADPNVTVLSAGLTPTATFSAEALPDTLYLQQMYEAGARDFFDVLGAHGAGYNAAPETSPEEAAANPTLGGNRVFTFRRVEELRGIMEANGDGGKQIWLTEFGWTADPIHPEFSWFRQTEEVKADYLVRAYLWALNNWPWIGVMAVWNLPSPDWGPEREEFWWSIANPDGTNRPAYERLSEARLTGQLP
ncbi:MAG: glycoside hydrolase 5 family protein [Chloroflexota bacterium]